MSEERDETRLFAASGEAARPDSTPAPDTVAGGMAPLADEPVGARRRPDPTAMIPAVTDEWAPSRGNPAWSGRAEVRAPQPGWDGYQEVDDWSAGPPREPRDRWWMPIVVGIVVLVLLGVLAWGIYLIVQNSGGGTPASTTPPSAAPARVVEPAPSAAASTEPTTAPATVSTTTEQTEEVTIPALRGMSLPDAQAALGRKGLQWRVIEIADEAPAGTVIDSDPAEGQEVPPNSRVTLVVAGEADPTPTVTATTTEPTDDSGVDDN
jgi:hypothetical protein